MTGGTLSDIAKRIRQLSNRDRSRRFSSKMHSIPGLNIEEELKLVSNKARFLSGLISGDIKWINRKRAELLQEIINRGFDPIPIDWLPAAFGYEKEQNEESPAQDATGYEYLTHIPISSLLNDDDTLNDLLMRKSELEEIMRSATPLYRGLTCMKISQKEPSLLDANYDEAQSDGEVWMDAKDNITIDATPRRRHKRTPAESIEASAMLIDNDDEIPELEDRLAERQSIQIQRSKKQRTKPRKSMCCVEC